MSPEHAAPCTDFEIITNNIMEQLDRTISAEIRQLFAKNDATIHNATNKLSKLISMLGTWVTQVQQQLLSTEHRAAHSAKLTGAYAPTDTNLKQERRRKEKRANNNNANNNEPNATTNTRPTTCTTLTPPRLRPFSHNRQLNKPHMPPKLKDERTCERGAKGRSWPHPNSS